MNLKLEMKRRKYLSQMGDHFAIDKEPNSASSAAERFAQELAGTKLKKTSVRGLESLAWSTESIADLVDYLSMRAGRDRGRHEWANKSVGANLAIFLKGLEVHAVKFYEDNPPAPDDGVRLLHLDLCREFIKHVTALFEFYKAE